MFISKKKYEKYVQEAYYNGNSDATEIWQQEVKYIRKYYQDKLIELRENIKTTKKADLVDKINDILKGDKNGKR